jgi:hypothetical protein
VEIGLLGLPLSGKTTLFHALTGGAREGSTGDARVAVVNVPDPRFDRLVETFRPAKRVPATVHIVDLAGIAAGEGKGLTPQHLARIGNTDAICAVVRGFDDGSGIAADPAGDLETLQLEMTLSDLQKVENRVEKLQKQVGKLTGAEKRTGEAELAVLLRLKPALEEGRAIRAAGVTPEEEPLIRGFQFLSQKPLLTVINTDDVAHVTADPATLIPAKLAAPKSVLAIHAEIEMEIAQLETPEERRAFMEDYGLAESARDRLVHQLYHLLGVMSFFSVSEKEVHAWTAPVGTPAQRAAGVIHSDLERGFIRAEVIHVDAFHACGGSLSEARKQGKLRTEGKTYEVQDGEIFHVLFSV